MRHAPHKTSTGSLVDLSQIELALRVGTWHNNWLPTLETRWAMGRLPSSPKKPTASRPTIIKPNRLTVDFINQLRHGGPK